MSQAGIINITSGSGGSGVLSIKGDDATTVLPDGAGNIQLDGLVVANGTHSKAVFTESPGPHIENIDVQVSAAIASTDVTKVGLASFDNTVFSVDANGFVQELQANATVQEFDDLTSWNSQGIGKFTWVSNGANLNTHNGTSTNPGILDISFTGISTSSIFPYQNGFNVAPFVLGAGSLNVNFVFNLSALSDGVNTYTIFIGLIDSASARNATLPTSGCFFKYTNSVNAGNWQIETEKSSVTTIANTSSLASTGFHNYGIQINAAATSVAFTIDGVAVANSPLTTNIPTVALIPAIFVNATAGTPADMLFDLFYYKQVLTTPR
jgi:hypothetical protein